MVTTFVVTKGLIQGLSKGKWHRAEQGIMNQVPVRRKALRPPCGGSTLAESAEREREREGEKEGGREEGRQIN